jgi:hypothetical protein
MLFLDSTPNIAPHIGRPVSEKPQVEGVAVSGKLLASSQSLPPLAPPDRM